MSKQPFRARLGAVPGIPPRIVRRIALDRMLRRRPWAQPDPDENRQFHLAVCAVFKDEAAYLREWIEFHRLVGVEKFFLYNNNSTDGYLDLLAPYVDQRLVTLHHIPVPIAQIEAYRSCLESYRHHARWIAFIDLDEFLFPVEGDLVTDVLSDYTEHAAVAVHWMMFGTSWEVTRKPGLVIDRFTRCQPGGNKHVKLVVDPSRTERFLSPHSAVFSSGSAVTERRLEITEGYSRPPSVERLRINHYWSKSVEEFQDKIERGRRDGRHQRQLTQLFRVDEAYNVGEDRSIQRYSDLVKHALASTTASGR